jgi:predicted transcriptional regulator
MSFGGGLIFTLDILTGMWYPLPVMSTLPPTLPETTPNQRIQRTLDATPATTDAYVKQDVFGRVGGRRSTRERNKAGVYARADAEVDLIVQLYFDGLTLTKIARMLGRSIDYVSRVFHSPRGRMLVLSQKKDRQQLTEELQDRIAYAAQQALDNIIELANNAASEAIRLNANERLLNEALPKQKIGAVVQVNIGDDIIANALRALDEVRHRESSR